ncbi:MAG TPA: hypothetical protein VIL82_03360 [Solirubrobacteraceae bacterium]
MDRLQRSDVDLERLWLVVRKSKSDAGTGRRLPIAAPLKPVLLRAFMLQSRPERGHELVLEPIGLHEYADVFVMPTSGRKSSQIGLIAA